jgi:hypothetical protein
MSKFVKKCVIAGIILVVAGGIMAATAVTYGASLRDIVPRGSGYWKNTFSDFSFEDLDYENQPKGTADFYDFDSDFKVPEEKGQQIYTTGTAKSLSADIRVGRIFIIEDPAVSELTIYCNKKDGDWHLEENNGDLDLTTGGGFMSDDTDLVMTISVPQGYHFSDVDLAVSKKKGLHGIDPVIACRSISADDMSLNVKAGVLSVRQGNVGDLDIKCSVGAVEYTGTTTGDINGECKVGAVMMLLSGKKEDYNYKIQSRIGGIKIADEQMAAIAGKDNWDYSANKDMNLDCSTGGIEVKFYE